MVSNKMNTNTRLTFQHYLQLLCARAEIYAKMLSLKMSLDDPISRPWGLCHLAATSATTWSFRLQALEPNMPEAFESSFSINKIKTLEALTQSAPLPMSESWMSMLSMRSDDNLCAENYRIVASEAFHELWRVGFMVGKTPAYENYELEHIEVLNDETVVFVFAHNNNVMLGRLPLHDALSEPSETTILEMIGSDVGEGDVSLLTLDLMPDRPHQLHS